MMRNRVHVMKKRFGAMFLIGLLCSVAVSAGEPRLVPPEAMATVDAIDLPAKSVTLNGKTYSITEDTRWIGLADGESPSDVAQKLVKHRLGFRTQYVDPNNTVVTEIWLIQ